MLAIANMCCSPGVHGPATAGSGRSMGPAISLQYRKLHLCDLPVCGVVARVTTVHTDTDHASAGPPFFGRRSR